MAYQPYKNCSTHDVALQPKHTEQPWRLQEKAEKAAEKEAAVSLHVPDTQQTSRDGDLAETTPEIVAP